jgi:hypothetical protein
MRAQQDQFETHHLTCLVCGAVPGTACADREFQELPEVHESRRMSISERNWRLDQGWQPPGTGRGTAHVARKELAGKRGEQPEQEGACLHPMQ